MKAYIMGAPTFGREVQEAGVEGTRIIKCELCDQPAFFAPSSLNRPEAAYATFVCLPCGLIGPSKYDAALQAMLIQLGVDAGILITMNREGGGELAFHGERMPFEQVITEAPALLRMLADSIERDVLPTLTAGKVAH